MTAFSTSVICQPLLALQCTKEVEVGERAREAGVECDWEFWGQRDKLGLFHNHKWGCIIIWF